MQQGCQSLDMYISSMQFMGQSQLLLPTVEFAVDHDSCLPAAGGSGRKALLDCIYVGSVFHFGDIFVKSFTMIVTDVCKVAWKKSRRL